jgi:hypothetical protein
MNVRSTNKADKDVIPRGVNNSYDTASAKMLQ